MNTHTHSLSPKNKPGIYTLLSVRQILCKLKVRDFTILCVLGKFCQTSLCLTHARVFFQQDGSLPGFTGAMEWFEFPDQATVRDLCS